MQDGAAVTGLAIAAASLVAVNVTGNPIYDPIGSIVVGNLLGMVCNASCHQKLCRNWKRPYSCLWKMVWISSIPCQSWSWMITECWVSKSLKINITSQNIVTQSHGKTMLYNWNSSTMQVAIFLIQRNRHALIGRAMDDHDMEKVLQFLKNDPV